MPSPVTRARTQAAREDRRAAILAEARAMLVGDGFEKVTVQALAERAGLAKGTLYLYFSTREEVFMALFVGALEAWTARVVASSPQPEALAEVLAAEAEADPIFLPLLARLGSVIELNLPRATLFAGKAAVFTAFEAVSVRFGEVLGLARDEAQRLALAVLVTLQGAAQASQCRPPDGPDMPAEVRAAYALSSFDTLARTALTLAVRGALA